jgi:formylglycine-generating enzyme required for sulfatase activity
MLGNVWEWCADGQRNYTVESVTDPIGPTEPGAIRVQRGGSWIIDAQYVRSAYRGAGGPGDRGNGIGFRCARVQS